MLRTIGRGSDSMATEGQGDSGSRPERRAARAVSLASFAASLALALRFFWRALWSLVRYGLGSSPDRPFQARFTRWAATSSRLGLRTSSQYEPVRATMPMSAWAYSGALLGSNPLSRLSSP